MKTINMGLNTEPAFLKADEIIERWKQDGNEEMVGYWERAKENALKLKDSIIEAVEADGSCSLNWSCNGETRFTMHAMQWSEALPQYHFEIGRYKCEVYKDKAHKLGKKHWGKT